jgi:hypothetical protein
MLIMRHMLQPPPLLPLLAALPLLTLPPALRETPLLPPPTFLVPIPPNNCMNGIYKYMVFSCDGWCFV